MENLGRTQQKHGEHANSTQKVRLFCCEVAPKKCKKVQKTKVLCQHLAFKLHFRPMWFDLSLSDIQTQSIRKRGKWSSSSRADKIPVQGSERSNTSAMHVHAYQLTDFLNIDTSCSQPSRLRCLPTTSFIPACAVREIRVTLNEWSHIRYPRPPPRNFRASRGLAVLLAERPR